MKKLIVFILVLFLFTGCTTQTPVESDAPDTSSGTVFIPPTKPSREEEPDITVPTTSQPETSPGTVEPEPTEPSTGGAEPVQITAAEVKEKLGGAFQFGNLLAAEVTYYWYPQGEFVDNPEDYNFVEARFTYNNIEYTARVKVTPVRTDITFLPMPWEESTETNILPDLPGTMRKCRVDGKLYTSILWYNESQKCTYSLFWEGGREEYKTLAPTLFGYATPVEIP